MISEKLKKELEALTTEDLKEIEELVKEIKIQKDSTVLQSNKKYNVFNEIAESSIETGIKDWARNHDHYLYGVDKKQ